MPGSIKARGSRVSRSIVQWDLPFAIWRQKSRRRQIQLKLPLKRQLLGHHPRRQFRPPLRRPPEHRNRHQLRVPIPRIGINRLQPGIHLAPYQGPSRARVRHRPLLQADNLQFRPCLNKSRPTLPFLLPERRRHDLLRMNPTEIPLKSPGSVTDLSIGEVEQVERALIDASTRVPVLMFYASAVVWLLLGTLLAGFTSFKLHSPDLLSNVAVLTWGRIRPAHLNVMLYGWASNVGMGTAIWLMARLCRTTLRHPLVLVTGGGFWNLGVLLGICGILMGDSTGYHWLEFPSYAAWTLFVGYSLIASWAVLMFRFRRGDPIYITQWYLLAAFLWFPWMYLAAQTMLFIVPVQGVLQAAVNWWYANNLLFLWFGSLALGTAYYMIPKVIGRPVYSYHLAAIGCWTYALFASWTGMQRLVDGPFPAWMITASIAAAIFTIIPVATVGLNHHMTMRGYFPLMRYSPTLRFTVFGAIAYTVFSLFGILISLRSMAGFAQFTETSSAYSHLGLYAFFTMIMFGSMYYIVPRLVGREWRYASLIKLHFWASAYGVMLMVLMLFVRGIVQGRDLNNAALPFAESTETVLPYLRGRSLAGILLTASHFIFAYHFGLMLLGLGRTSTVPTFLNPVEAETSGGH